MIDEKRFAKLYSEKASRPNTPVNIIVGGLLLQQLTDQTDEEMITSIWLCVVYRAKITSLDPS